MSASDFSGRLVGAGDDPAAPAIVEQSIDRLCSIRFSLRTMISGARNSMSRFQAIVTLMTRR